VCSHQSMLPVSIESIGNVIDKITVQLSARFLEHFSQQLYSSPNKAFEELLANSWDAGARTVHVVIPEDLTAAGTAIFVLDDGMSMDAAGLHDLLPGLGEITGRVRLFADKITGGKSEELGSSNGFFVNVLGH
jgi:hypothetical protein